jgi:Mn-dependent DtxR family transcriptional regulator
MPLVLHESAEMYLETILNLEEELDRVRAVDDACRVEHYISDETFNCLKSYVDKNHPQA